MVFDSGGIYLYVHILFVNVTRISSTICRMQLEIYNIIFPKFNQSVDSISRDGTDITICNTLQKISEQVSVRNLYSYSAGNYLTRPRTFIKTIVHVRTSCLKKQLIDIFLSS